MLSQMFLNNKGSVLISCDNKREKIDELASDFLENEYMKVPGNALYHEDKYDFTVVKKN